MIAMRNQQLTLLLIIVGLACSYSFRNIFNTIVSRSAELQAWPGNRPPVNNMNVVAQKMDATWGKAKFRTEIWNDDVNPVNDWWKNYAPSQEEIQAAKEGFDFKDVKGWCESKGIDYEKAVAETAELTNKEYEEFCKDRDAEQQTYTIEEFTAIQEQFFALQNKAFEMAFRIEDNILQEAKGQPSLDNDDTGAQWKND